MASLKRYFITNGQFLITTAQTEIYTVLGSCVSVCLWDKQRQMAGMNHYLLPGSKDSPKGDADLGYSSIAMLIRSMLNRGAHVENIEAKVFGGCNSWSNDHPLFSVGKRNVEVANTLLQQTGIQIIAQHTGGSYGRKIIFNTATSKVKMFMLSRSAAEVNEAIRRGFSC
ncbi:chemotaxis protein CheD [Ohtaekwangia koreensis]|uniref:Probable chemoreceptor glutamine deamidase CheD n=1 Tax=Ohtaekwangia koreensis TaxID=688867 RepID=A0A1T5LAM2_9BACT|nr:chemotaxis protein CheD [Ohtaekwangia koreensis]SKC73032.1 chemotaxis protein CheD [Ohtaekwangia koreensis]